MKRCAGLLLLAAAMWCLPEELLRAQAPVTYVYDNLGRLIGVVDTNGDSAVYVYDAVGNLLSIARAASGTVSVLSISPQSGPVGTTVTISGIGYSAVPSQNTVLFNGTSATVTASSATQLTVTVPAGATTGTVSVTAPAGSAAGGPFTVTSAGTPTITGFAPPIAPAGASVTITGTNFSTVLLEDRTQFTYRVFSVSFRSEGDPPLTPSDVGCTDENCAGFGTLALVGFEGPTATVVVQAQVMPG